MVGLNFNGTVLSYTLIFSVTSQQGRDDYYRVFDSCEV